MGTSLGADAPKAQPELPSGFWDGEWSPERSRRLREEFVAADRPAEPAETAEQAASTREFVRSICEPEVKRALSRGLALTRRTGRPRARGHRARRTTTRGSPGGEDPGGDASADDADGEGAHPVARQLRLLPRAAIYCYACLDREVVR